MPLRLLSSSRERISFQCFLTPEAVPGGYVALSHVWGDREPSFEEIRSLADGGATFDDSGVSPKIRQCRRLAKDLEIPWFWSDAPCIDQRNNTELSEAISSMYHWYSKAAVCIAHLPDVPGDDTDIRNPDSAFRTSAYFKRGWTLQELIAPRRVVFVAEDWSILGDKSELADLLEEITGIDADVLRFRLRVSDVNVARRLSWASGRKTRRVEDEAYCLMGLFNIHMSIRYGEGHEAFERLQRKILKADCDHTLLAWGGAREIQLALPPGQMCESGAPSHCVTTLFAPSPAAFSGSRSLTSICIEDFVALMEEWGAVTLNGDSELLPRIVLSDHYGLECNLPVIGIGGSLLAAVLACKDESGSLLALPLQVQGSGKLAVYGICCCEPQPPRSGVGLGNHTPRLIRLDYASLETESSHATTRPFQTGHQTATTTRCARPMICYMRFHILKGPSLCPARIFLPLSPITPFNRWASYTPQQSLKMFAGGGVRSRINRLLRKIRHQAPHPTVTLRAVRWLRSVARGLMGYIRCLLA
ncbi:heterokaryon incompatibility protein-domain-containing protein [Trametes meyenii]|nr:heterokaryon incompatibility protein-domain-containing protein [Trametes meyenii]